MRIAIHIHSLGRGGAERSVSILSEGLVRRGHDVMIIIVAAQTHDSYRIHNAIVRKNIGDNLSRFAAFRAVQRTFRLRREIQNFKADVVLGFMTTSALYSVMAIVGTGKKVICCERSNPKFQSLSRLAGKARFLAFPYAEAVICQTQGAADWYKTNMPLANVKIIPNAIRYPLESVEPQIFPHEVISDSSQLILAVGRLDDQKGFDLFIRAVALCNSDLDQIEVVIIGDGPDRESLADLIDQLEMHSRIHLVGEVGNLADWYKRADIFVSASYCEGFPNVLLEAMSYACPVLATNCDYGPAELITDGVNGQLVDVGSISALSDALPRLVSGEISKENLSQSSIEVRSRFSPQRVLDLWESALMECVT